MYYFKKRRRILVIIKLKRTIHPAVIAKSVSKLGRILSDADIGIIFTNDVPNGVI